MAKPRGSYISVVVAAVVAISGCTAERDPATPSTRRAVTTAAEPPATGSSVAAPLTPIAAVTPSLGKADPAVVRPGGQVTITPAAVVQRMCADISPLERINPDGTVSGVGWLGNIYWQPGNPTARTVPGCAALDSDYPASFVLPSLAPGTYRICLGAEKFVAEGCAAFAVAP